TLGRDAMLWFYRTRSGREVDLLVTTSAGVIGIEVKNRTRVDRVDGSGLRALGEALGAEWLGGLVVHRGEDLLELEPGLWAVPVHRLF
ncbi:MAG: ATP-binding protein, partial [Candidatus Aminicenantes bacterium]|nr:ATP-binding protein [Candidatus Aminicenantes bacterium]